MCSSLVHCVNTLNGSKIPSPSEEKKTPQHSSGSGERNEINETNDTGGGREEENVHSSGSWERMANETNETNETGGGGEDPEEEEDDAAMGTASGAASGTASETASETREEMVCTVDIVEILGQAPLNTQSLAIIMVC